MIYILYAAVKKNNRSQKLSLVQIARTTLFSLNYISCYQIVESPINKLIDLSNYMDLLQ